MTREWWGPATAVELTPMLGHRRWWWHTAPFPHVRVMNLFSPRVAAALEDAFSEWLINSDGGAPLPNHDLQGTTITADFGGPLQIFASAGWRDLVSTALGVPVTRFVNIGLHHHRSWCNPGFPHTDLNPGWFAARPVDTPEWSTLAEPKRVEYTTGRRLDLAAKPVRTVRAIAILYYLANPPWEPGDANCTGLYRSGGDDPGDSVALVPPHRNSLLAFECTPWSFHGFAAGGPVPRNSVVQWFHRTPESARRRWGPGAVTGYAGGGT